MEYVGHKSLYDHVKCQPKRRLHTNECRVILKRLAEAMCYFHAKDIAHRDLKLENILYIKEGVIKVIDFGFAVQSKEKQRTFCGTPTYMAPEIVKRIPYKGSEVDVWALGIMVYRMLTGTYPFMAKTDKELYKKIICGSFEASAIQDESGRDLVSRMLRVSPAERPTAAEVQSSHIDSMPSLASICGISQRRSCFIIVMRGAKNSFIILKGCKLESVKSSGQG